MNRRGLAPPDLQSGAFDHLATSRKQRFRSRVPEPPNRCGRFASRGVSACATSGCWRRVRDLNPRCKVENLASWPLDEHDLKTSTSAVPSREPSRRRWRLAARGRVSCRAHPAPRTPGGFAASECGGTPEVKGQTKRPGSFAGSGPLEFRVRLRRVVRRGCLPDRGDPRTRNARVPAPRPSRHSPARRRARTHGSRRGLGRCEGRSGCSRWVSWCVSVRGAANRASCK